MALTMFNYFGYMQKEQEMEENTADANTLTPSDYSVYFTIGPECDLFNSFLAVKD